jgi:hypothetical protein
MSAMSSSHAACEMLLLRGFHVTKYDPTTAQTDSSVAKLFLKKNQRVLIQVAFTYLSSRTRVRKCMLSSC